MKEKPYYQKPRKPMPPPTRAVPMKKKEKLEKLAKKEAQEIYKL